MFYGSLLVAVYTLSHHVLIYLCFMTLSTCLATAVHPSDVRRLFSDGASPLPNWKPEFCVCYKAMDTVDNTSARTSRRLVHYDQAKVCIDARFDELGQLL